MRANWELIVPTMKGTQMQACAEAAVFGRPLHVAYFFVLGELRKRVFHLQFWPKDHVIILKTSSLLIRREKSDGVTWAIEGKTEK